MQNDEDRRRRRKEVQRQLSPWSQRRIATWTLMVLAVLIAGQHVLAHLGWGPLPLSMGWQDLLVGYPMAGVLAVVGLMLLDPRPRR